MGIALSFRCFLTFYPQEKKTYSRRVNLLMHGIYYVVRLISILTRCSRVLVRNGRKRKETHIFSLLRQKEIGSVIYFLQPFLAHIARQVDIVSQRTGTRTVDVTYKICLDFVKTSPSGLTKCDDSYFLSPRKRRKGAWEHGLRKKN